VAADICDEVIGVTDACAVVHVIKAYSLIVIGRAV
jgi:hypothetical protein